MGLAGGGDIEDALWFIKTGDSEVGPVSTDEMVAMIEAGEVSARTQVQRQGGCDTWLRIDATPLLAMAREDRANQDEDFSKPDRDDKEHGWFFGNKFDPKGPVTRVEIVKL
jgi:hypothetical protein